jgi:hypothetical protein
MFKALKSWLTATPTRPHLAVRLGLDAFEDRLAPSGLLVHEQTHQATMNGAGSDLSTKDVEAQDRLGSFQIQELVSRWWS